MAVQVVTSVPNTCPHAQQIFWSDQISTSAFVYVLGGEVKKEKDHFWNKDIVNIKTSYTSGKNQELKGVRWLKT